MGFKALQPLELIGRVELVKPFLKHLTYLECPIRDSISQATQNTHQRLQHITYWIYLPTYLSSSHIPFNL